MISFRAAALPLLVLSALAASAEPRDLKGTVDWAEGVIRVTGSGPPDFKAENPAQARLGAERSAKEDAARRVLAHAAALALVPGQPLGSLFPEGPAREKLVQVARAFRVREKRYYSDHGLQLDVELPLGALVGAAVAVPQRKGGITEQGEWEYTGLLVDARGLGVLPSLTPRLVDEEGVALYGADWTTPEARGKTGVAAFFEGLEKASRHPRVGDRPLVLKASGMKGADLVLTAEAAAKLRKTRNGWLSDARVGVVIK